MNFYERYINGEFEQVYKEIYALEEKAFLPSYLNDIEKVLKETFERVAYNSEFIFKELQQINYVFNTNPQYNFEKPLHKPLSNTKFLLTELDNKVSSFGYVPLSLKYFYEIVGGINFAWDYETNENFMWNMADPIQICSLDTLANEVVNEDWKENMEDISLYDNDHSVSLDLAADDLHKDNVSGGAPYALQITKLPSIDAKFLNEPNDTTFIHYLRICFDYCGFPGNPKENSYKDFVKKVKPKLKPL